MGRLIPAGTGMEYYRHVKIAGEDVEEEPIMEREGIPLEGIPGYEDEARVQYAGGLSEGTPDEFAEQARVTLSDSAPARFACTATQSFANSNSWSDHAQSVQILTRLVQNL